MEASRVASISISQARVLASAVSSSSPMMGTTPTGGSFFGPLPSGMGILKRLGMMKGIRLSRDNPPPSASSRHFAESFLCLSRASCLHASKSVSIRRRSDGVKQASSSFAGAGCCRVTPPKSSKSSLKSGGDRSAGGMLLIAASADLTEIGTLLLGAGGRALLPGMCPHLRSKSDQHISCMDANEDVEIDDMVRTSSKESIGVKGKLIERLMRRKGTVTE